MDNNTFRMAHTALLVLMLMVRGSWCAGLRLSRVRVSTPVEVGSSAFLECDYETNSDQLYTLKWYNGLNEFYRWTPTERPQVKVFPAPGITVDEDMSHEGRVRIRDVRMITAIKKFRCEISAEAPSFHTDSRVASMTVIDPPESSPFISPPRKDYQVHEEVNVNCTSFKSKPAAILDFFINDEKADPKWLVPYPPLLDAETGLETSILGLRFLLRPHHLQKGPLKVKCTAAIYDVYWDSTEHVIPGRDYPHQAHVMTGRAAAGQFMGMATWLLIILTAILNLVL